eukprot:90618_1
MATQKSIAKKDHPTYLKMCSASIIALQGSASLDSIISWIEDAYPSSDYKISNGTRLRTAVLRSLKKDVFEKTDDNQYKINAKKVKKPSKKRNAAVSKPPAQSQSKHQGSYGKYMCCSDHILEHKIDVEHMNTIYGFIDESIEEKLNQVEEWNKKLQEVFDELADSSEGNDLIMKEDMIDLMIFAGYTGKKALQQLEHICSKMNVVDDKRITFEQVMIATPSIHRYHIYTEKLQPKLVELGYAHYNQRESHPFYGTFVDKIRKGIPDI